MLDRMTEPKRKPGRPPAGRDPHPVRGVRIPDTRWDKFGNATNTMGTTKSEVINDFVAWYVHEHGAKRPTRPEPAEEQQ